MLEVSDLLKEFTKEQIELSTYTTERSKIKCIRLVNRYSDKSLIPALYPDNYTAAIIHYQSKYSNVTIWGKERKDNEYLQKKLDMQVHKPIVLEKTLAADAFVDAPNLI